MITRRGQLGRIFWDSILEPPPLHCCKQRGDNKQNPWTNKTHFVARCVHTCASFSCFIHGWNTWAWESIVLLNKITIFTDVRRPHGANYAFVLENIKGNIRRGHFVEIGNWFENTLWFIVWREKEVLPFVFFDVQALFTNTCVLRCHKEGGLGWGRLSSALRQLPDLGDYDPLWGSLSPPPRGRLFRCAENMVHNQTLTEVQSLSPASLSKEVDMLRVV